LAKLFVKPPFISKFTGFDQTMGTSAVLSVICEAAPFIGAAAHAKTVRSDIRNKWAYCNSAEWTEPKFKAAFQSFETLLKNVNLSPNDEQKLCDELNSWKIKGTVMKCYLHRHGRIEYFRESKTKYRWYSIYLRSSTLRFSIPDLLLDSFSIREVKIDVYSRPLARNGKLQIAFEVKFHAFSKVSTSFYPIHASILVHKLSYTVIFEQLTVDLNL
jgi:hypothetical protein